MNARSAWGLTLVGLGGCIDYGYTQARQEDVFPQNRINSVDVLLVIDNSCSMVEEQANLAVNFDSFIQIFESAEITWQIGVVTTDTESEEFSGRFVGGDDEIMLIDAAGEVADEVRYDSSWGATEGVSLSLDPSYMSALDNDSEGRWCRGAASPGSVNPACGAGDGEGASDRYGAVIVTEFLADPGGVDDSLGEWVELTNVSASDVDLSDWALADHGKNLWSFPQGTVIPAGSVWVGARSADSGVNGGVTATAAFEGEFTLNNDVRVLSPEVEGAAEIFSELVAQGTTGAGIEMGLEAARLALSDTLLNGHNAGFLRDSANLSVVIVSDEEDSSPLPVDEYLNIYAAIKGDEAYRDHSRMSVSGVVGDEPPPFDGQPSCSSSNGNADYGSRYVYAAYQTGGLLDSICNDDFAPIVQDLGLTLTGLEQNFTLSRLPVVDSLEVSIYESADRSTKIRDLTLDVDYSFVEETNSLSFSPDQIPGSEQFVVASYLVRSGSK